MPKKIIKKPLKKKIPVKESSREKVIELFLSAKLEIQKYVEKGMDFDTILRTLETRPYRCGDFVIDCLIAHKLWEKTHGEIVKKIDEKELKNKTVDDIKAENLMPATNFFKLYLGCEKFISYKGKIVYSPDLLRLKKGKLTKRDLEKIGYVLNLVEDLPRIRAFAFRNHYLVDVDKLMKYKWFSGLYFAANIIDYETDTLMAVVSPMGFFAADAELFEKIGREIYHFKAELSGEEKAKYEI